jgi:tRNA 2-thiouridine synthesizing protein A
MDTTKILKAAGHACVNLTPEIKKAMKEMNSTEVIEVFNDDPASRVGVPAWCRLTGNELLDTKELNSSDTLFYIRKK